MTRALRTTAVQKPKTQGERIRFARLDCGLSQEAFAKAVGKVSGMKLSKSLVSKWELDEVANPNNTNMLAMQAVTGFSVEWLVHGGAPKRVQPVPNGTTPLQPELLARAIRAAAPKADIDYATTGRVAAQLYELLLDTPEIAPAVLERFATTLRKAN